MNLIVLLLMVLRTFHIILCYEWPLKRRSFIDGDLFLGGFFPVHGRDNERICGKLQDEGLIELEAMLYAVDVINNSSYLPGIKLGVIGVDSCDSIPQALEEAVDFAKGLVVRDDFRKKSNDSHLFTCGANVLPHFESEVFERVAAIIGGHSSWVSRQVADLMRIYKVPQVSYQSTNPALSNKGYEYFFRTVPPLTHQMRVILEILKQFNWTYIAVVYADSAYGNLGFETLNKLVADPQYSFVCFSSHQRINVQNSKEKDYDIFMSELLKRNATAVIVFGDHEMARNLMSAATRARASKRFVWIGSTAWVGRDYVISGNEDVLEGAIGITHDLKPFNGFDTYLMSRALENHRKSNPWFPEYWEKHLNCRVKDFEETPFNGNYTKFCPGDAVLPPSCYLVVTPSVQFVRDAVYSVAQALHNMYTGECKSDKNCLLTRSMNGEKLREYLSKVEFEDENKNLFKFDDKGDGPPRYSVVNLQKIIGTDEYYWLPVGTYYEGNETSPLQLDKNEMKYKADRPEFPESHCSAPCTEGQAIIFLDGEKCCWHCTNCMEHQYVENDIQCFDCPQGTFPNLNRNGCKPISPEYMHFSNPWAIGSIFFSLLGIVVTICTGVVISKYWKTPVIMASGRELSCILLIGIILSFSLTFQIVSKPSDVSCSLVRYCLGLFYTVSYATIAVKVHYINRLFKRAEANKKPKRIRIKPLILIILSLIAVEGSINAAWLLHSPPTTDYQYPSRKEKVFICKGSDSLDYLVGLVFPFFLMVFCTIYAFRIRAFTGAFNESRYLNFTNYTTFVLWLAFLPMFVFNNIHLLRVIVLSLLINLTAYVQLVCLFFPKVYIALLRPEKNRNANVVCCEVRNPVHTGI